VLVIKVLPDGRHNDSAIMGLTHVEIPNYRFPTYGYNKTSNRITQFTSSFTFVGPFTIQTVYGPKASRHVRSQYGRGTTREDRENGDVTLGFHESCHRRDYVAFLTGHALPELKVETGMTIRRYDAAVSRFE